jgi:ribosomal protein L37AE/L43A
MPAHYPRSTVSAEAFCKKCQKPTQHRIDDRRIGPCLECMEKLEAQHAAKKESAAARQENLFREVP